ncbi:MAG: hypothetical protein BMS9Abin32_203 [Gammaproteobacteria bacterium]|nr:MAG: hypothetical protein BMS9Abin32_203 [Gammaproteobacteria bacterium]
MWRKSDVAGVDGQPPTVVKTLSKHGGKLLFNRVLTLTESALACCMAGKL